MSETPSPLAKRIVAAITRLGQGNGLRPADVVLIGEENGQFTLHGTLAMTLEARREQKRVNGRPAGVHFFNTPTELEAEIARACTELSKSPEAAAVLDKHILGGASKGFGLKDKIIPIPKLAYDFGLATPCPVCHGKGKGGCPVCHGRGQITCVQCNGQREEWCGHCKGNGHQDGDHAKGQCTWCAGIGRTRCLRCNGNGFTACQPCNGSGHSHCRECLGKGEMADVTHLSFVWHGLFTQANHVIPRAVSHLMAKAPLEKLAELGHIGPSRVAGPLDAPPLFPEADAIIPQAKPATLYYQLAAIIPWCEAVIKINGQPAFQASAAGLKGRVNHCPAFLDKIRDKASRLQNEALSHLLRLGMKQADKALAKLYPLGLSERVRRDILVEARHTIAARTQNIQIGAWILGILASAAISYVMNSLVGVGMAILLGITLFQALSVFGKMQFAKEYGLTFTPRPKFGWEMVAVIVVAVSIFIINLLT